MEIKQLEWRFDSGFSTCGTWIADCIYRYTVYLPCGTPSFTVYAGREKVGSRKTLAAAKRAAQQHFESTVKSALVAA